MRFSRAIAIVFLATFIFSVPASATIMRFLDVEDLTRRATDIVQGEVMSVGTFWSDDHKRIYTKILFRVDESMKGFTKQSQSITITQLGGEKDGMKMDYAGRPELSTGQRAIIFATKSKNNDFIIIGLRQGMMHVSGNEVTRDFTGIKLIFRSSANARTEPISIKPIKLSIDELRTRIRNCKY